MECRDFEITETLRLAEQGYTVHVDRHGVRSVRAMPWRQILNHLCTLQERFLLRVVFSPDEFGEDIVVERVRANGRAGAPPSLLLELATICSVDRRAGLCAKARYAKRVEMALRSAECRRLRLGGIVHVAGGPDPAHADGLHVAAWEYWLTDYDHTAAH